MVDDIEVINQVFYSLKPEIVGEYLLEEFVALDNGLLSLLMERNTNIKSGINPLIGLSKPVLLSVLSVNFLLQSDKKRIVSLLPDPGLIALPQIASLMIAANRTPMKLDTNLPSGTDMYFNMPSVSLNVKYYGLHPELKDRLAVGDLSSKFSLPIEALRFATSKPRRKQVEVDPVKVLKWLTYDQSFVPPHISFNGSRFKKIVLLTNISKFKKNQKDFRPFGADLGTFIDFQYETTSGRVTSLFPQNIASKKAIVNVYSSPEIAFERLEEIGEKLSQTLLVCDDYRLANRFLGLMPDAWGFENLTIILIVDLHAREVQKTAAARNF